MTIMAGKEAEKTSSGECFMAMRAATRKVLSPISEKMIMVKARTKEWRGCISVAGTDSGSRVLGDWGFGISRELSLVLPDGGG